MDTDSFVIYIKTDDIYKDLAEDVETSFNTSHYELDRPFPKRKKKKMIRLIKDKLGEKIMKKLVGLIAKIYSYLIDVNTEDKKVCHKKKP